jgi:hypothetical protein
VLMGVSSTTFFASAVLAARHEHPAFGGYILAIVVGVLLAGCNGWIMYKAAEVLANLTTASSASRQGWWGRAFSLVVLLWLPLAAYLGDWVSSTMIRLAG